MCLLPLFKDNEINISYTYNRTDGLFQETLSAYVFFYIFLIWLETFIIEHLSALTLLQVFV